MTKLMKRALIATAVMNVFGALLFVPPVTFFRKFFGFPADTHPLYLWIISLWIFFFGICYLWLGLTERREPLFLAIAAAGKISFSLLLIIYAAGGEIPAMAAASGLLDLFFGLFFIGYLWKSAKPDAVITENL